MNVALGGSKIVQAYGMGVIVGEGGELEQGTVWRDAGRWAMRELLGNPKPILPASRTTGGVGTRLILPLAYIQAAFAGSHFGSADMTVWDGLKRDEIGFGLATATTRRCLHAGS